MRQEIIEQLETLLGNISTTNGYSSDFNRVLLWDDVPAEYSQNAIYVKDTREKYEKKNKYTATLRLEIIAIVMETPDNRATKLGNIALADLIKAVSQLNVCGSMVNLVESHKWIETKGQTACQVELNIDVKYQF